MSSFSGWSVASVRSFFQWHSRVDGMRASFQVGMLHRTCQAKYHDIYISSNCFSYLISSGSQ